MLLNLQKPHKGALYYWKEYLLPTGESYFVGFRSDVRDHNKPYNMRRTSLVVAQDHNEIETLNSRYTLMSE